MDKRFVSNSRVMRIAGSVAKESRVSSIAKLVTATRLRTAVSASSLMSTLQKSGLENTSVGDCFEDVIVSFENLSTSLENVVGGRNTDKHWWQVWKEDYDPSRAENQLLDAIGATHLITAIRKAGRIYKIYSTLENIPSNYNFDKYTSKDEMGPVMRSWEKIKKFTDVVDFNKTNADGTVTKESRSKLKTLIKSMVDAIDKVIEGAKEQNVKKVKGFENAGNHLGTIVEAVKAINKDAQSLREEVLNEFEVNDDGSVEVNSVWERVSGLYNECVQKYNDLPEERKSGSTGAGTDSDSGASDSGASDDKTKKHENMVEMFKDGQHDSLFSDFSDAFDSIKKDFNDGINTIKSSIEDFINTSKNYVDGNVSNNLCQPSDGAKALCNNSTQSELQKNLDKSIILANDIYITSYLNNCKKNDDNFKDVDSIKKLIGLINSRKDKKLEALKKFVDTNKTVLDAIVQFDNSKNGWNGATDEWKGNTAEALIKAINDESSMSKLKSAYDKIVDEAKKFEKSDII